LYIETVYNLLFGNSGSRLISFFFGITGDADRAGAAGGADAAPHLHLLFEMLHLQLEKLELLQLFLMLIE